MLVKFFFLLRKTGVPVSITELLTLLEALKAGLGDLSAERFYYLARTCLVKDERFYDRYDRAFAAHFKGVEDVFAMLQKQLPADWLEKLAVREFTDEEKAEIEAMGGWEKLMETLKKRLEEQKERHQGGNKWIGTAGTSPFGAYGFNPEGVRIGQDGGAQSQRREGLGQARIRQSRRQGRARHAQHQDRAAPAAKIRAARRAR